LIFSVVGVVGGLNCSFCDELETWQRSWLVVGRNRRAREMGQIIVFGPCGPLGEPVLPAGIAMKETTRIQKFFLSPRNSGGVLQ
jgi:hypothetical protein